MLTIGPNVQIHHVCFRDFYIGKETQERSSLMCELALAPGVIFTLCAHTPDEWKMKWPARHQKWIVDVTCRTLTHNFFIKLFSNYLRRGIGKSCTYYQPHSFFLFICWLLAKIEWNFVEKLLRFIGDPTYTLCLLHFYFAANDGSIL